MKRSGSRTGMDDRGPHLLQTIQHGLGIRTLHALLLMAAVMAPVMTSHAQVMIAIVKSKNIAAYDEAIAGFADVLKGHRVNAQYEEYLVSDKDVIGTLKIKKPDIIYTLGMSATLSISKAISTIPVVFAMVTDPAGAGIQAPHVTGSSLDIPASLSIGALKRALPEVRNVGIFYNKAENSDYIRSAEAVVRNHGLILQAYAVESAAEIPDLKDIAVDVLWMIPDTIVCKSASVERLFLTSLEHRIPVMGISSSYAKAGAIMAVSCDYEDIGAQAGETACMILDGIMPASIAVTYPRMTKLYLNLTVADRLNIKIPETVIGEAQEVYGR